MTKDRLLGKAFRGCSVLRTIAFRALREMPPATVCMIVDEDKAVREQGLELAKTVLTGSPFKALIIDTFRNLYKQRSDRLEWGQYQDPLYAELLQEAEAIEARYNA